LALVGHQVQPAVVGQRVGDEPASGLVELDPVGAQLGAARHPGDQGDRDDPGDWWDHALFLRCHLQRSNFDFVMALRIWYSAHRDDDDAGNNEKHANPTEWPHDHSANRITYAAALGVSLQGMRRDQ